MPTAAPKYGAGRRGRERDLYRGSSHERGYTWAWRQRSKRYLQANPLCVDCSGLGLVVPATESHHIKKKRDGGSDEDDNLMALCRACHSKRTQAGG